MRYLVFIIALVAILLPGWSGEETPTEQDPVQLPAAVIRALDTYDAEVQKAQAAYRKVVDRAKVRAARIIERQQKRATKAGDLEGALAIKAKAEELEKHNPGGLAELDILGNKIKEEKNAKVVKSITEAKWTYNWVGKTRVMEFRKDGTIGVGSHANENKWTLDPKDLTLRLHRGDDTVFATLKYNPEKNEWRGYAITGPEVYVAAAKK